MNKTIVSEFVSVGHPDKIADQISDSILDAFLVNDKNTRAGIEVLVKDNVVVLGGEIKTTAKIDYDCVVRNVFERLDFPSNHNLNPDNIKIVNLIGKQSPEINSGVEKSEKIIGAGDQGFCVGFASNETETYLPLGVYVAKKICQYISQLKEYRFGPDTKSQVIVDYTDDEVKITSILVSTMQQGDLNDDRKIIHDIITKNKMGLENRIFHQFINNKNIKIDVNPCGSWKIGGPVSDCGVTGRKIVVDQFGGYANVGGGNLHGKDMSKVDRSAAYMSRYLAKNIVASGICNTAKVELSYMIGVPEPCSINIELDKNNEYVDKIKSFIAKNVDLTPYGIITRFTNSELKFENTAIYGHYGCNDRNNQYPWEKLDLCSELSNSLS